MRSNLLRLTVDNCLANPGMDDLQAFVDDIVQNEKPEWCKPKLSGSLFQWMQLLSGGQDIDSKLIIDKIFELQILPSDLETYFKSSLEYTLSSDVMTIKRSLGDFRPEKVRLISMDFSSLTKRGHRKDRTQAFKPSKEVNTPDDESKPSINYLSNFDEANTAEDYVRGKVRTTRTDASLKEDLVEILRQVERDPYGIGAGKFKNNAQHYILGERGRRIYKMYYKPSRLPGFVLKTQEAYRYRPVYHIEEISETERLVIIDDLPHHDRFDQDYNN